MIFNILQALEKKYENIFKLSSSLCYRHLSHQNRTKILRAIHHLTLKNPLPKNHHGSIRIHGTNLSRYF